MKGHIRPRGKLSWALVLDLGRDENGKRRQRWHTVKGTKRDAQRELARLLHALNTGEYVEPTRMTTAEFLRQWLRDYARVAPRTLDRYTTIVNQHLIPALGGHLLSKLHPLHIQDYYRSALEAGRRDGKGGLSSTSVVQHHAVLHRALKQAVKLQLIIRNPADAVEPPRRADRQMQVLDDDQTKQLLQVAATKTLYIPVLLAVSTGMRRGEILGLRWKNVDLAEGTVYVCESLEATRAGLAFKSPKTRKSRRLITLAPSVVEALRRHRVEQAKQQLRLGPAYQDSGLVCPSPGGRPWNPNSLSPAFRSLIRRSELPRIRFHDLRHTHATSLLRHNVHPKIVSERLGHANIGITLDTYSHVLPGLQEEAARKFDVILQAASE